MYSIDEIIEFVKLRSGAKILTPSTDIFEDCGIVGDDFHELMQAYMKFYQVDMSKYLWYFHSNDEGLTNFGGIFFKPPYARVKRIPITPTLLMKFANSRKWSIKYPEHKVPNKRYDLLINKTIVWIFIAILLLWICDKWISGSL